MGDFFNSPEVVQGVYAVCAAILSVVASMIALAGRKFLQSKTENNKTNEFLERVSFYLNDAEQTVKDVCTSTYENVTKRLKEASADGKLTPEEIKDIQESVMKDVQNKMSAKTMEVLQQVVPDTSEWILRKAEAALPLVKTVFAELKQKEAASATTKIPILTSGSEPSDKR